MPRQGFVRPHLGGILQRRWQHIKRRDHQGMMNYRQGQTRPLTQAQYQQHLQRPVVPPADDRLLSMETGILELAVSVQMTCLGQQISHRAHIFTVPQGQQRQIERLLSQVDAQWQGPPSQKATGELQGKGFYKIGANKLSRWADSRGAMSQCHTIRQTTAITEQGQQHRHIPHAPKVKSCMRLQQVQLSAAMQLYLVVTHQLPIEQRIAAIFCMWPTACQQACTQQVIQLRQANTLNPWQHRVCIPFRNGDIGERLINPLSISIVKLILT
ncbi:hypothetical protein BFW41_04665 [Aeromonas hydrophila]|nr:hypothetical protein BFW41_04665 [Aeromonas hydrophila]